MHYFQTAIKEKSLQSEALEEIFRDRAVLFDSEIHYHKQIGYAAGSIRQGLYRQAAEFVVIFRDQYDQIDAYKGRFAVRIANAVHDWRWHDVVRIIYKTIRKKLEG